MISQSDYIHTKARLMLAANAATQIVSSDQPVQYEQGMYERVTHALLMLSSDLQTLFGEMDVMRAMYESELSAFLQEGFRRESEQSVDDARRDVGAVEPPSSQGGGEGEPSEPAGPDGRIPQGRLPRKRTKRSKPRRNQASDGGDQGDLGRADGADAVGGEQAGAQR